MSKLVKNILIASAGLVALAAGSSAKAADMPIQKAPLIEYYNWSGFYSGGFVGAAWGHTSWENAAITGNATILGPPVLPGPLVQFLGLNPAPRLAGVIGGTQSGFNYQFGGWVIGAEVEFGYSNAAGTADCSPSGLTVNVRACTSHMSWYGTAAGRIGVAWDRLLVYGKAGGAYAKFDYDQSAAAVAGAPPPDVAAVATGLGQIVATAGEKRGGWIAGAGFEFGFTPNWSGKAEYNYMDFGSRRVTFTNGDFADIGINVHTVKIGLNYRWGGYGPLHARY